MTQPLLPPAFLSSLSRLHGVDAAALASALDDSPTLSIHINKEKYLRAAGAMPPASSLVPWATDGFYLAERPRFTFDPLMHAGAYYVEEPSSMFVEQAWKRIAADIAPARVLDLCAAPGGKTLMLGSLMSRGLLVSNEVVARRATVLSENVAKWGRPDVLVSSATPREFSALRGFFDVIATDVPCSGEGMFRKDMDARTEWSDEAPARCAARQREIVGDVWPALRDGGYLIYSTCTFNPLEDEDMVEWICTALGADVVPVDTTAWPQIAGDTREGGRLPVYHFFPHLTRGEGFFLALLRKQSRGDTFAPSRRRKAAPARLLRHAPEADYLTGAGDYSILDDGRSVFALHASLADDYAEVASAVRLLSAGVSIHPSAAAAHGAARRPSGRGAAPLPAASLALSQCLRADAFADMPLDYARAVRYLRGEALTSSGTLPRGAVTVSYRSLRLGFANNVGQRLNNAYPATWRIRSTYIPETQPELIF